MGDGPQIETARRFVVDVYGQRELNHKFTSRGRTIISEGGWAIKLSQVTMIKSNQIIW